MSNSLSGEIGTKVSVILHRLRVCWAIFPKWAAEALLCIDPKVMVSDNGIILSKKPLESRDDLYFEVEPIRSMSNMSKKAFCHEVLTTYVKDETVSLTSLVSLAIYERLQAPEAEKRAKSNRRKEKTNVFTLDS